MAEVKEELRGGKHSLLNQCDDKEKQRKRGRGGHRGLRGAWKAPPSPHGTFPRGIEKKNAVFGNIRIADVEDGNRGERKELLKKEEKPISKFNRRFREDWPHNRRTRCWERDHRTNRISNKG